MSTPTSSPDARDSALPGRARRACGFCSRRKIRCSRDMPSCTTCKMNKRQCSYRKITVQFNEEDLGEALLPSKSELGSIVSRAERTRAAISFLDRAISKRGPVHSRSASTAASHVPGYVKRLVGDAADCQRMAAQYYLLVHPWLPIVPRKKVYDYLLNPLAASRADTAFLLLCMKLVVYPEDIADDPCTSGYKAAVQLSSEMHSAGIISAEALQGAILLASYEIGHAIYPAAHVRIGSCFKYAIALGMSWRTLENELPDSGVWVDQEEEIRTWWAVYLLERVAAIGNPKQALSVPEPDLSALLPYTEPQWEKGANGQSRSTISSPPESLGRFAGVVQSSYLLSRVFHHSIDESMSPEFRRQEVEQLDKTLKALIRYSEYNRGTLYSIVCYQTGISFCALLQLYTPYMEADRPGPLFNEARDTWETSATVVLKVAREYLSTTVPDFSYGDISPFGMHWLYKMGAWFLQEGREKDYAVVESAFRKLDKKWKAAGTYLELLSARRVMEAVPI